MVSNGSTNPWASGWPDNGGGGTGGRLDDPEHGGTVGVGTVSGAVHHSDPLVLRYDALRDGPRNSGLEQLLDGSWTWCVDLILVHQVADLWVRERDEG